MPESELVVPAWTSWTSAPSLPKSGRPLPISTGARLMVISSTRSLRRKRYNQNLWISHLNLGAAYLPR